jgi:transcriptional regulator with XRE-family HTH domain
MAKTSPSSRRGERRSRRRPRLETLQLLSSNLKLFRTEREYSQERLADEAGLHRTYVGDLERCEQNPTLSTLEALADTFGIQIGELLLPTTTKSPRARRGT